jgi:endonuclease YncB( thermonuclease family)
MKQNQFLQTNNIIINDSLLNSLQQTSMNIPEFTLKGINTIAKVVDVYDGDTCKVVIDFNGKMTKFTIRLNGYDSPEMRTSDLVEKEYAVATRNVLQKLILNKVVVVKFADYDKYGRVLGDIYVNMGGDMLYVNEWMINSKLVATYGGGKKEKYNTSFGGNVKSSDIISLLQIPLTYDIKNI